ncbi:hypothetical protein Acr_07g0015950 [Actinidia rufa]|uniref:Pectinesterase inhibitor domain-containing protein n=1 Tax=Actinidia rufa TaxID=165716 RepID=A0A7J0EZM5_9ERIC|nr:hypothetical protein Acr_07g0015950 [Actinidia rufa]
MAAGNHLTFSLLFVAAVVVGLFFAGGAEARFKGINPWCLTADYRFLCTKMVKGATTQEAAITNAILATLDATTLMVPKVEVLMQAVTHLPEVSDDNSMLDRIDTADSSISDCVAAVKEMGGNMGSLAKTSRFLYRYVSNAMAVATQL